MTLIGFEDYGQNSPLVPGFLNEWWPKKNGRLNSIQCKNLGMKVDTGWMIHKNTIEYIHLIFAPEYQLMSLGNILP